jgi:hypothetical protein
LLSRPHPPASLFILPCPALWIPASAGMTVAKRFSVTGYFQGDPSTLVSRGFGGKLVIPNTMPAEAGIQENPEITPEYINQGFRSRIKYGTSF